MLVNQKRKKISSRWEMEFGDWSDTETRYINRKKNIFKKEIVMGIVNRNGSEVLQFYGGPTGYESYYVDSLKTTLGQFQHDQLCICAGTINKYAACYVKASEVLQFLKDCG